MISRWPLSHCIVLDAWLTGEHTVDLLLVLLVVGLGHEDHESFPLVKGEARVLSEHRGFIASEELLPGVLLFIEDFLEPIHELLRANAPSSRSITRKPLLRGHTSFAAMHYYRYTWHFPCLKLWFLVCWRYITFVRDAAGFD